MTTYRITTTRLEKLQVTYDADVEADSLEAAVELLKEDYWGQEWDHVKDHSSDTELVSMDEQDIRYLSTNNELSDTDKQFADTLRLHYYYCPRNDTDGEPDYPLPQAYQPAMEQTDDQTQPSTTSIAVP